MARFIKDRTNATGQAPGSLIFIGNQKMDHPIINLIEYSPDNLVEKQCQAIEEAAENIHSKGVTWINIYGIHDLDLMKRLGEVFDFHPLLLEDILNTDQRPKYDDGENNDAFILKMLFPDEEMTRITAEQVTIILGENYVLTLQEKIGDVFEPVRERIRQKKGRIRQTDNDYLAYVLLDTIIDNYLILIENIGDKIEELEDAIFQNKDIKVAEDIHKYKVEINFLRKTVRPVKDIMLFLLRSENSFFQKKNKKYLTDLAELVEQATEAIELYNGMLSDQLNMYNTNVSNRTNDVMKVLTIFASIFIPLTFIAGIYGMNFEYLPELKYKFAYPIFWGVVVVVGGSLLLYFKKKKWL